MDEFNYTVTVHKPLFQYSLKASSCLASCLIDRHVSFCEITISIMDINLIARTSPKREKVCDLQLQKQ
jgi:hypothetical protein